MQQKPLGSVAMNREKGPVAEIFEELVSNGFLTPVAQMEDLRFPGELPRVPTGLSYNTPDLPHGIGMTADAELGQRSQRNFSLTG